MTHLEQLARCGFQRFARIDWREPTMDIVVEDPILAKVTIAVYAFVVGDIVARIGITQGPVIRRVRHRAKRVTDYLRDGHIPASDTFTPEEAERWRQHLNTAGGAGCVFMLAGQTAYDAERRFIKDFGYPPCNMCSR